MKNRVLIGIAAILTIAVAGVLVVVMAGLGGAGKSAGTSNPRPRRPLAPPSAHHPARPVPTLAQEPRSGPYFKIVQLRPGARVPIFTSPGGQLVSTVEAHSEFGSPLVLGVVREGGSWLGVETPLRPDGRLGWVRFDASKLDAYWTRYSIRVLVSRRLLELRYGDRVLGRYTVTVGAPGSGTPAGRFAITDALIYGNSPYYGCCALALSGHQEHLPLGWLGGDRIAIHGTPGAVGYAASHGCIRATDETMRILFRRVPLGTPVFVGA